MKAERVTRKRARNAGSENRLEPIQPVNIVMPDGLHYLSQQELSPERVGHKAFGLASLPPGWTKPFFVVDARCDLSRDAELSADTRRLRSFLREALEQLGAAPGSMLIVRSSGTAETLNHRGSLESATCRSDQLPATLRELMGGCTASEPVHWVVQLKVETKEQGHLSNERRLKEEPRDWIAEFERQSSDLEDARLESLSVREWRDGTFVASDRLPCRYASDLRIALKLVAQWGMKFSNRLHFEWVWDGSYLNIVQVDVEESQNGVDPTALIPDSLARAEPSALSVFRPASPSDFAAFAKLKNAALYRNLGYEIPPFYVLDDQATIGSVLNGKVPEPLISDLGILTAQPLIIRVDGASIPLEKREMLPRSDTLRTNQAAEDWLLSDFAQKVNAGGLQNSNLCLIAHHFVPAVASAWARAEPANRWVRIESLWGVPEGLYWYSHDTFEVDTIAVDPAKLSDVDVRTYTIRDRPRYKGIFVAPSPQGQWIAQNTKAPFDWRRSISKDAWVREIAEITRKIAIEEQGPTSVMWLVDVHPHASSHQVLPWFHCRSEYSGAVRAAPRRKISSHRDFTVRDRADWEGLKELARERRIDRVKVEPKDAALIRNQEFAESLIELSRSCGFVVELAGGILSHIYYVLTSKGCKVECIDLYGGDEETLVFNKVVRDHIPRQIQQGGERVEAVRLEGNALDKALRRKLVEEALEVLDADGQDDARGELADVLEVLEAIAKGLDISWSQVESERERKKRKRGAFDEGWMLVRTSTPHSITLPENLKLSEELSGLDGDVALVPQSSAANLNSRLTVKPDLRAVRGGLEKLISFSTELPALEDIRGSTTFRFPGSGGNHDPEMTLEIELHRKRGELRGAIRIRSAPAQFTFDFEKDGDVKEK